MTFNSQVSGCYALVWLKSALAATWLFLRSLCAAVKAPLLCSREHNEILRGDRAQYVWAPVLFQALVRMVVWIQERGWKTGGIWDVTILLKMSVPTRAACSANRRGPAANWHDRRCILSVSPAAPTKHRGPLRVSEPVNHLCSRSKLPTLVWHTFFFFCNVL